MPEASSLRRDSAAGETVVSFGRRLVFRYRDGDLVMRNLAISALRQAGVSGLQVAEVFALSPEQVSRLSTRARRDGSAGLALARGRPPKLSGEQVAAVVKASAEGKTQVSIARRFGVSQSVISEVLSKAAAEPRQGSLVALDATCDKGTVADGEPDAVGLHDDEATADEAVSDATPAENPREPRPSARIGTGVHRSRYAGAALLYPYLSMVGATEVFSSLTGAKSRRYDDLSVLATALMGFALGFDTVEGTKHLRRGDAGALVGVDAIPELRTLRTRLSELADGSDPLALQRDFAKRTMAADPPTSPVYYVDDHFVAYSGARPVAKGWNTRRRHAEPGRDDTLVSDSRGRAVVFSSSQPSGLSATMGSVLAQLREVTGAEARILLGFDRGGSYPKAFGACRQAGMDWVTYRRGKLAAVTAPVRGSWVRRDERRVVVHLADETVTIAGYGTARQLTLFERGAAVLQVLTSDMTATGAALVLWLRGRWSIENLFKYAAEHNGLDSIASYLMDVAPDTRRVANPERKRRRAKLAAAEGDLADAERALAQVLCDPDQRVQAKNAAATGLARAVERATRAVTAAREALEKVPAKVAATDLDPDARRATMRLERRGLQMVCRLLAFNAEAWLAEHLNAYLGDADEYRAVTRNLLHLGGSFDYGHHAVTVTFDRPDTPKVARALDQLVGELNAQPARLLGDHRPLRFLVTEPRRN